MITGYLSRLGIFEAPRGHRNDKEAVASLYTLDNFGYFYLANDGGVLYLRRDEENGARCGWIGQNAA